MSRIACLRIPRFQIVVHRKYEPELKSKPLVLISRSQTARQTKTTVLADDINLTRARIFMCSEEASKHGVLPGMRLPEARALCADLIWRETDEKLYVQTQKQLLKDLLICSPRISSMQSGILLIDAGGLQRLGGENQLCRHVLRLVSSYGYTTAKIGVANSAFTALVATRFKNRRWYIVFDGCDRKFLAPLSIEHLPIAEELKTIFVELGIKSLGQLAALPAQSVLQRFGEEGKHAHELARGIDFHHPSLPSPERRFQTNLEIGGPVESLNDTLFLFKSMLDRLTQELKVEALMAETMTISFFNDHDRFEERTVQLIRPSNHSKFLLEVCRLSLEAKPLQREFTAVQISIDSWCNESWKQSEIPHFAENIFEYDDPIFSENGLLLLQRLRTRIGEDSLVCATASDHYLYDQAGVWTPVIGRKRSSPHSSVDQRLKPDKASANTIDVDVSYIAKLLGSKGLTSDLVIKRFAEPIPVLVQLKDSRPAAIAYCGNWYKVEQITVPECISTNWWDTFVRKSIYTACLTSPQEGCISMLLVSLSYDSLHHRWCIEGIYD